MKGQSLEQRFADKWDRSAMGCHIWNGSKAKGYGIIWSAGHMVLAHRLAYRWKHPTELIDGLVVDHLCGRTDCVNADHLRAVPQKVNVAGNRHNKKNGRFIFRSECGYCGASDCGGQCQLAHI